MLNTEILAIHSSEALEEKDLKHETNCFICGKKINKGIEIKKVLSAKFTNFSDCKDLSSNFCCKECAICIKDVNYRRNNIVADRNNIYLLKKNDLENYLFDLEKYVGDEFIVCITTSFKKHNSFRCRVNQNTKEFYIREEDKEYLFKVDEMKYLYEKLNEAYLQFGKDELETGNYKMISIVRGDRYEKNNVRSNRQIKLFYAGCVNNLLDNAIAK